MVEFNRGRGMRREVCLEREIFVGSGDSSDFILRVMKIYWRIFSKGIYCIIYI